MPSVSILAVVISTVVTFLIGGAYYAVLGGRLARAQGTTGSATMSGTLFAVEVVRCLVLALVACGIGAAVGVTTVSAGLLLGLVLWIGFPLVLWIGAVSHEGTPIAVAVIHAGDWLLKLLAIGVVVGLVS